MNEFPLCRYTINKLLNGKKVSGIGIGHYGIGYRRCSKQSIGIGIGHHGVVPSLTGGPKINAMYNKNRLCTLAIFEFSENNIYVSEQISHHIDVIEYIFNLHCYLHLMIHFSCNFNYKAEYNT